MAEQTSVERFEEWLRNREAHEGHVLIGHAEMRMAWDAATAAADDPRCAHCAFRLSEHGLGLGECAAFTSEVDYLRAENAALRQRIAELEGEHRPN